MDALRVRTLGSFTTFLSFGLLVACSNSDGSATAHASSDDASPLVIDAASSDPLAVAADGGAANSPVRPKRALVYRGPGTCDAVGDGCAPAWAAMFRACQPAYEIGYVGPREASDITAQSLASADVLVYPGGNDSIAADWRYVKQYRAAIRAFVQAGGHYLGSCTGGYLAATNPWAGDDIGFGLLPSTAGEFVASRNAGISTTGDTLVNVVWPSVWGASPHPIYLQDGPNFAAANANAPGVKVLATYASNGTIAALVAPFGSGKVGVEGPHAEAPADWYEANDIAGHPDFAPGCDLIAQTLAP